MLWSSECRAVNAVNIEPGLKDPEGEAQVTFFSPWQQAEAGQGPSGLFVHMQPSSEFYTTNPQGPGGSWRAALLPQHTGRDLLEALMEMSTSHH